MSKAEKGMTLGALVMMIFTSVFGFANGPVAFYLDGVWLNRLLCRCCDSVFHSIRIDDGRIRFYYQR